MDELLAIYESKDDIPEPVLSLYEERDGKFELTKVKGMKTEADVRRVQTALEKERNDHKSTKERYKVWDSFQHEDVVAQLDRIPELEAAAAGKLDDDGINEIVEKRMGGKIRPYERKVHELESQNSELAKEVELLRGKEVKRMVGDAIRGAAKELKVLDGAIDDALLLGETVFKPNDDGSVTTEDGLTPRQWLEDLQAVKTHWWAPSHGGGASGGLAGSINMANNPFSHEAWNLTKQGQLVKENPERAAQLAKAAGTRIGGLRPKGKKG